MEHNQICRAVLLLLKARADEHGLHSTVPAMQIYSQIKAPEKAVNIAVDHLADIGFIKVSRHLGSHFDFARLTGDGLSLVVAPSEFTRRFPPAVSISGNQNVVGSNISIANSFNVVEMIEQSQELDEEIKELLTQIVRMLGDRSQKPTGLKALLVKVWDKATDQTLAIAIPMLLKLISGAS